VIKKLSVADAVALIQNESSVMVGGFGNVGNPKKMIDAIAEGSVENLTVIANDLGTPNAGLGRWVSTNKIRKAIGSYFTYNPEVAQKYRQGLIDLQLMPQGTFAEAIRAGGVGIGGFYTRVGLGTELTLGLETKWIDGQEYVFAEALKADYALIHARKADELGNLVYEKTARNFNPIMAMAAKFTIVEVEEIVPAGCLSPEEVVTPFVFVDAFVPVERRV
jgi:3-oxoacid CoA-transferase subunit A/3-oxoadipate CoA-transferase alpha subunit